MKRLVAATVASLGLVACGGEKRSLTLEALDGSGVVAAAHLEEVTGKSGKVISARLDATDPGGRALVGVLLAGRCASPGAVVDRIQIATVPGHLSGSSPTRLSALAGSHAVAVFVEQGFSDESPGRPVACGDL